MPTFFHTALLRLGAPCLGAALLLVGCALEREPADFTMLGREPETVDPGLCTGQPGGRIIVNVFEGLTRRHPQSLAPEPGIAASWDISEDGQRYTFHLRRSQWSDGRALRSHDFRYAWTRLLDPATAAKNANLLYAVRGGRAFNAGQLEDRETLGLHCPDDSTFVVELESPVAYFLDLCAHYALSPVPRWVIEAHGDDWIHPRSIVSNGPFRLDEWQINRRVRLRRNPLYWDAEQVSLAVVDILHGENANSSFNRYASGVLDWVDSEGVPSSITDRLRTHPDMHVGPYLNTYFFRFNVTRAPLNDARVRRALYHAVDPEAIVEHVTRGGQIPAHSLVPPGLPGYTELALEAYQPDRARALLAEAGFPAGAGFPAVTLLFNTSESHKQIAEVVQQQWKRELGIDIRLQNQEWKVFMSTTRSLDYDISRGGWIGDYLDPNTFLEPWLSGSGNNRTGFASAAYDSLLHEAARCLDPAARMAMLRRCEEIVTREECIVLPMYYYVVTNLFDGSRWTGLEPNLLNSVDLRHVRRRPTDGGGPT